MKIIKLNATSSTNSYLKQLLAEKNQEDFTVVVSEDQTNGRGQQGNSWLSEAGKNLTFSVLRLNLTIDAARQFILNQVVSLAIYDALFSLNIPDLAIKWPNDIMSGSKKLAGILIENQIKGTQLESSIIGIGLNVNQTKFEGLPKASSMKNESGQYFDLMMVLQVILEKMRHYFQFLHNQQLNALYERYLFKKDEIATFENEEGKFKGTIIGVDATGKLLLQDEEGTLKSFTFKSISMHY